MKTDRIARRHKVCRAHKRACHFTIPGTILAQVIQPWALFALNSTKGTRARHNRVRPPPMKETRPARHG